MKYLHLSSYEAVLQTFEDELPLCAINCLFQRRDQYCGCLSDSLRHAMFMNIGTNRKLLLDPAVHRFCSLNNDRTKGNNLVENCCYGLREGSANAKKKEIVKLIKTKDALDRKSGFRSYMIVSN